MSLICLVTASRIICSITFPRTEVRLIRLRFFGTSFSFWKTGMTFAFFQSSRTFADSCDLSDMTFQYEWPLSDTGQLSQCLWVHPISPNGLFNVLFKCPLTSPSSTEGVFLSPEFTAGLRNLELLKASFTKSYFYQ